MHRIVAVLTATGVMLALAMLSLPKVPGSALAPEAAALKIKVEAKNPWTNLNVNARPGNFQFAIVTDRTGGRRPGVFAEAVRKLNLLQPEFVISVGDLIEGYTSDPAQWALEWAEFQQKLEQLEMPFFYVPGNHDLSNVQMLENWGRRFGRTFFEFRYHDVLFLALNSEDPPETAPYRFSPAQQQWVAETLKRNADVRWTFVFLHKPVWMYPDEIAQTGWLEIERSLSDRNYTVFAGHIHRYGRYVRNGRDYIMLATTGGASKLRGKPEGEFDQVVWVTMKEPQPVIANLLLSGIEDKAFLTLPEPKPGSKKRAE
jgi:hypothetical protein